VICVAGDGAFTMLMGELATLARYDLPVKIVLVKNNELNQVRWEQIVQFGYPEFAVELQPIDFAAVARACGAAGYTLEDPAQAEAVLRGALTEPGAALVECVVDPNEPPMPGKITTDQAIGFAKTLAQGSPIASRSCARVWRPPRASCATRRARCSSVPQPHANRGRRTARASCGSTPPAASRRCGPTASRCFRAFGNSASSRPSCLRIRRADSARRDR
jgi:hypothetical protein